jgi:hypothetical protein
LEGSHLKAYGQLIKRVWYGDLPISN